MSNNYKSNIPPIASVIYNEVRINPEDAVVKRAVMFGS
jgi:hypothetical protein